MSKKKRRYYKLFKHVKNNEKGSVAVIVALSLIMLFGFAALAVDLGFITMVKNELQNGADAGGARRGGRSLHRRWHRG